MPALIVTITGDADKLKREMAAIDAMAKRTGQNIKTAMRGDAVPGHGVARNGAMRETLVLLREIGRGNWTRVPGSFSLLVQQLGLLKYLINPVTIALGALGTTAFFVGKYLFRLAEDQRNLNDLMDLSRVKFSEQVDAMKRAAEQAQSLHDFIDKWRSSEENLADSIRETITVMKDKARLDREAASFRGAGKNELMAMDEKALAAQLQVITTAKLQAGRKVSLDDADLEVIENEVKANAPKLALSESTTKKAMEMANVIDKLQNRLEQGEKIFGMQGGMIPWYGKATAGDALKVNTPLGEISISLDEAKKKFGILNPASISMAAEQKKFSDKVSAATEKATKDKGILAQLTKMGSEVSREISNREGMTFGRHAMLHGPVNALQRIGAYTSPASSSLLDVSKKMENHLKQINDKLGKLGAHGSPHSMGRVKF